jgi:hypothetical protein
MSDEGDTPDQAQSADPGQFAAGAIRPMESHPRTVVLRHDDTGSYQILMGSRVLQGFCQEFEDVTGCSMGVDLQQRVRIHIEYIGRRQQARYPDRQPPPDALIRHRDPGEAVMIRTTEQGIEQEEVALFSSAHPQGIERWPDIARRGLQEEMTRLQDMLNLLEGM